MQDMEWQGSVMVEVALVQWSLSVVTTRWPNCSPFQILNPSLESK